MKFKKKLFFMCFVALCFVVISSNINIVTAQKKPKTLKLDANTDDKQLCKSSGKAPTDNTQFCDYYDNYEQQIKAKNYTEAKQTRNLMIDLVRGQVDTYFKLRKDGRKTKIRWLQTLFDILEIGTATAITITNGERAKTVIGAALNGFQAGRTSVNKNFEILQTQILINKMTANRLEIFTVILNKKDLDVDKYSWYAAKNDLRNYLFAGTFNNALDSLVNETGAEVEQAEKALREVGEKQLTSSATLSDIGLSEKAAVIKNDLRKKLKGKQEDKDIALKRLQAVVKQLESDDEIQKLLEEEEKEISSDTKDGEKIRTTLRDIIIEQTGQGRKGRDIVARINQAYIDFGQEE